METKERLDNLDFIIGYMLKERGDQCSPKCPQRINIPNEMQRIDQFVEALKQNTLI